MQTTTLFRKRARIFAGIGIVWSIVFSIVSLLGILPDYPPEVPSSPAHEKSTFVFDDDRSPVIDPIDQSTPDGNSNDADLRAWRARTQMSSFLHLVTNLLLLLISILLFLLAKMEKVGFAPTLDEKEANRHI